MARGWLGTEFKPDFHYSWLIGQKHFDLTNNFFRLAAPSFNPVTVDTHFLLGPAGSGKTFRCLAEIRRELIASPDGPPLLLLAPKQATFQLERQLLAEPDLHGYTRLHILSFERLATFALNNLGIATHEMLNEEGRVMVLRALLMQRQSELKVFRASARLTGFAQQLSLLLREFQRHQLSAAKLETLSRDSAAPSSLRDKLHDLALLRRAYADWLKTDDLQDAENLLDVAAAALNNEGKLRPADVFVQKLWLDGFAEMTPQEMELLAALVPHCGAVTLAFCLESEPTTQPSWLSTWSVVASTFRHCHTRLAALDDIQISIETLPSKLGHGRFAKSEPLRQLEQNWSRPLATSGQGEAGTTIQLVACANAEAEVVCAAREILRHVHAGGRYRECAVIMRALDTHQAALERTFRRYDIPFFMDARESVAHHPLAELTRFALRTIAFNWRHDDWFGALKTGLVPVGETEIDWLENLALARGWEGKTWHEPVAIPDNESLAAHVELLRKKLLPPFLDLSKVTGAPISGKTLSATLRDFWRTLEIEQTLAAWANTDIQSAIANPQSAIHTTVLTQMAAWLDNLARAFATEALPLRDWLPIIEAGLANLTVGVVPPALDQVLIGAIDRSRNPEIKLACILGLNEGVFPAPPTPGCLLTDTDRTSLEKQDIYLGPTQRQRLGHERYFGYIAVTRSSQRLVVTRALRDAKDQPLNPSPFFDHLKRITGVAEQAFNISENWWESEHVSELAAPLLRSLEIAPQSSPSPRPSGERAGVRGFDSAAELLDLPTLQPLVQKWEQVQVATTSRLSPDAIERLFTRELKSSVSRLEDFAACPFKFFAASGLRLQERKEFQFDDRDKGSFHHDVLEEFHKRIIASGRRWRDLAPTEAANLIAAIAREKLPTYENGKFQRDGAARFTGELLIERLQQLITALIAWMPQYNFDPTACEIAFNDSEGALPTWRFELGDGRALKLGGRIDRVDLLKRKDGTALAVVMDYKSRVRKLDETKLYHGLELQLLSYLGVLNQLRDPEQLLGVKSLTPAGVFYVPLNGGAIKTSSDRAEILAVDEDARRAAYQHSGRFLAEELARFDNRNVPKGDQFKYAKLKSGDFAKRGNEALPAAAFSSLREKVEGHLRDYGTRIFTGQAQVSPYRLGQHTACDYCDFRPVCRFDPWTQPFRVLQKPAKEE
ncbi:MAG: PD-(D/E)XK nuclease family protein [Verrucomicrobiota bacterium]